MRHAFRQILTLLLLICAVGLLIYRQPLGLAFLPLFSLSVRYWFKG